MILQTLVQQMVFLLIPTMNTLVKGNSINQMLRKNKEHIFCVSIYYNSTFL
jgi:hypothetical protein